MGSTHIALSTRPLSAPNPDEQEHPLARVRAALLRHGARIVDKTPDRFRATCPAHDDRNPSLTVTEDYGRVLMHCFAGCANRQILSLLGLKMADLFHGSVNERRRREIETTYEYSDATGMARLQKVRYVGKQFKWRRSDPSQPGQFLWGLDVHQPGLYRLQELAGASMVIIVEGEKAVDRLARLGLRSTCPPTGASCWKPEWSQSVLAVKAGEVLILADRDVPGAKHAERVAALLLVHSARGESRVKVVYLPGLPSGGDVVDYLDAGHGPSDLLAVAAGTPYWKPGLLEEARRQRRNEQAAERMRRQRAARKGIPSLQRPDPDQHDAAAIAALAAVIECLTSHGPSAGRELWRRLRTGACSRRAIERAIQSGVESGTIERDAAEGPGRANVYRCVPQKMSAPASAPAQTTGISTSTCTNPQKNGVPQCPVTPFAVTQRERTSIPLPKNSTHRSLLGVTHDRDTPPPDNPVPHDDDANPASGPGGPIGCCGQNGAWPRCKLCGLSPTYWRRGVTDRSDESLEGKAR